MYMRTLSRDFALFVHYRFSDRPGGVPPGAAGVGAFSGGRLPPENAPTFSEPFPVGGSHPHFSRSRAENGWALTASPAPAPAQILHSHHRAENMPPAKRKRTDSNPCPLPTDPLKRIGRQLSDVTSQSGFTTCDLFVVLKVMKDTFGLKYSFLGPCEGSIHITEQDGKLLDKRLWITDKRSSFHSSNGSYTEVRFDLSKDLDELQFLDKIFETIEFSLFLKNRDVRSRIYDLNVKITDKREDVIKNVVLMLSDPDLRTEKKVDEDEVARMLNTPLPLCLRPNYPCYTWPRWLFGAFEGLVMRRVQINAMQA